jgi:hypothetical protein
MRSSVLILVASYGIAGAKPLPKDLQVVEKDGKLLAVRGGLTVPLFGVDSTSADLTWSDLKPAELSADGTQIVIKAGNCRMDDEPIEVPLAAVEARLDNAAGMQVHVKKKYDDAIAHFARAVQRDPATPVYATNLLSAQALANKLEEADRTIATHGPRNVPWFAWRLAVDPELARVRTRPSAAALVPVKPSSLTYKALGDALAVSPLGLVAVTEWIAVGQGPSQQDVVIYDKTNRRQLRLHAVELRDACEPGKDSMFPCAKGAAARTAKNTRVVDQVLAALGFEKQPLAFVENPDGADKLVSPDKKTTIEAISTDTSTELKITRGKTTATAPIADWPPRRVGFGAKHIVLELKTSYACGGADSQQSYSIIVSAP